MAPLSHEVVSDVMLALEPAIATPSTPVLTAQRTQSYPSCLTRRSRLDTLKQRTSAPTLHATDSDTEPRTERDSWPCQKALLAAHSPYFRAMFLGEFKESWAAVVFLPRHVFSSLSMEGVLQYVYTHTLGSQDEDEVKRTELGNELEQVEWLQELYIAADYLCMDDLCSAIYERMSALAHQWTCHCRRCQCIVPLLLGFGLGREDDARMTQLVQRAQRVLTNEPDKVLSTFWTSRTTAELQVQLTRSTQHHYALPSSPLSSSLSQRVWRRISKCNAIETLHACFCASTTLARSDPLLGWSRPLHATLASAQARATQLIARHFDFFCTQYPALLSCIDGVSYSYEFLEYLLLHVLEDQMDCSNAGTLYQGLIRDLMCRHVVQRSGQVRHILTVAQTMILQYMTRRLGMIQATGALHKLDTAVLKSLAHDLAVHPRVLASTSGASHCSGCNANDHHGLGHRLWLPLRHSVSSASSTSDRISRRSSVQTVATQRTRSSHHSNHEDRGILGSIKDWFTDSGSTHGHALHQVRSLCSGATATVTPLSWAHVPLSKPKTKRSMLVRRLFPFLSTCQHSKPTYTPAIAVGKRVQLTRRPLLTVGTVAYVGGVDFADGVWLGVELDRRVGKNDGSANGKRYFRTSPNRGVFVRIDDVASMYASILTACRTMHTLDLKQAYIVLDKMAASAFPGGQHYLLIDCALLRLNVLHTISD